MKGYVSNPLVLTLVSRNASASRAKLVLMLHDVRGSYISMDIVLHLWISVISIGRILLDGHVTPI